MFHLNLLFCFCMILVDCVVFSTCGDLVFVLVLFVLVSVVVWMKVTRALN